MNIISNPLGSPPDPLPSLLDPDEVKTWLRVAADDEDDLIQGLIDSAQRRYEGPSGALGRTLVRQGWTCRIEEWPSCTTSMEIPLPPLVSVDEVRVAGVVVDASAYSIFGAGNGLIPAKIKTTGDWSGSEIEIDFTAGYEAGDLPPSLRVALLQVIAGWYDNRAAQSDRQIYSNAEADRIMFGEKVHYI
jgi:uncharacterized phiE125 gp8 family phage protein